jgi:hypothetical protein
LCPEGIQLCFESVNGELFICKDQEEGCTCGLTEKLQEILGDSNTSLGVFLKITPEQVCSWLTQISLQDSDAIKQVMQKYFNCHCGDPSGDHPCSKLVFNPPTIPDKLCVAEKYKYLKSHLPIGEWCPLYQCIINTPYIDLFERFSYTLSGNFYYLFQSKTPNTANLHKFIQKLERIKGKIGESFDSSKSEILEQYPIFADTLEIQDEEDVTLGKIKQLVKPLHLPDVAKYRVQGLYYTDALLKQLNAHIFQFDYLQENPNSIFGVIEQVISRFEPQKISRVAKRYVRLLREIIQKRPLIEPETAAWAIQHPKGITGVIKLFNY